MTCPCTKISVTYHTFIHVNHSLHQICSSVYVTDQWINYILNSLSQVYWADDFRILGLQQFRVLAALCQQAEDVIAASLSQFYSNYYVSAVATSVALLRSQADALVQQFISSTTNSFSSSLRLIRDTTQANQLMSGLTTNYYLSLSNNSLVPFPTSFTYDDDCDCRSSSACISNVVIFNGTLSEFTISDVPGFYAGCFVLEALRQSFLECLYNQTCLIELQFNMQSTTSLNVTALDPSASVQYRPDTTIGVIVDELMVEAWNWSTTHEDYYAACQPDACSYTVIAKNGAVYIVTTLIGLIGGLVTALKLLIPRFVSLIFKRIQNRKRNGVQHFSHSAPQLSKSAKTIHVKDLEQ